MPAGTADALRAEGYDAVDIRDLGSAATSDAAIFHLARDRNRAVVTRDLDFVDLVTAEPGHPGLFLLRVRGLRSPSIIGELLAALRSMGARENDYSGAIVVVEPGRVRIRRSQ